MLEQAGSIDDCMGCVPWMQCGSPCWTGGQGWFAILLLDQRGLPDGAAHVIDQCNGIQAADLRHFLQGGELTNGAPADGVFEVLKSGGKRHDAHFKRGVFPQDVRELDG